MTVLETQIEMNRRLGIVAAKRTPRWENMDNGSWAHPKLGIIRKSRAVCQKTAFEYFAWPHEMDPTVKLGPFQKRTDAIAALQAYHGGSGRAGCAGIKPRG
jgi:hypothetical protein